MPFNPKFGYSRDIATIPTNQALARHLKSEVTEIKILRFDVNTKSKVEETVVAHKVGPLALVSKFDHIEHTWEIYHIQTGLVLPTPVIKLRVIGLQLMKTLLSDNPSLCWNFGSFGNGGGNSDTVKHAVALREAIKKVLG